MLLLAGALLVGACGDGPSSPPGDAGTGLRGSLTVFAAASLTDAFDELGGAFEADHPDVDITFNFGASSALREQILGGAPADVFASADQANIDQVLASGGADGSRVFATNLLQIAVPAGNPAGITGLASFADADLLIGLCAEQVPCGRLGRRALTNAGVRPSVDTNAPDVRALLTQLGSGDLDAGLVYVTDVLAAGDAVDGVEVPLADNVRADYLVAPLTNGDAPALAAAFIGFLASDEGQAILADHGFGRA